MRKLKALRSLSVLALCSMAAVGCADNAEFITEARMEKGMVVILPGIEGASALNKNIRRGFIKGGVEYALPIQAWGRPVPLIGVALNQIDVIGNRISASFIADSITQYQDNYPGRPVYVVGHSGGGGIAVFVAEGMPEGRQIDGVILLSASISSSYDLQKALSRCKNGIVNFYNPEDIGLLGVGTAVAGNVDGGHGPSAGQAAFALPKPDDPDEKRRTYTKLWQVEMTRDMSFGGDPHTGTTEPGFVATFVAGWVLGSQWPASYAQQFVYVPSDEGGHND